MYVVAAPYGHGLLQQSTPGAVWLRLCGAGSRATLANPHPLAYRAELDLVSDNLASRVSLRSSRNVAVAFAATQEAPVCAAPWPARQTGWVQCAYNTTAATGGLYRRRRETSMQCRSGYNFRLLQPVLLNLEGGITHVFRWGPSLGSGMGGASASAPAGESRCGERARCFSCRPPGLCGGCWLAGRPLPCAGGVEMVRLCTYVCALVCTLTSRMMLPDCRPRIPVDVSSFPLWCVCVQL